PERAPDSVTDRSGRGENGKGGELAERDRNEDLPVREPAEPAHEVVAEKREQDIAAAVQRGADFQKGEKQRREAEPRRTGGDRASGVSQDIRGARSRRQDEHDVPPAARAPRAGA